ncbi:MAG: aminotransferase class I/II-fold pyridoxal phosphate-dependent enzyme [Muribaculaceae bacterium]|nr:aminotransferase class I/II-fold pyridoxal phosphate-dependent enzyme [Muribaculaceae bacterium]
MLDTELDILLTELAVENRCRAIPAQGRPDMTDLCSNDYLGLGQRSDEWHDEFLHRFPDAAMTSSASRLLSRRQHHHILLEDKLEKLYRRPALVFNSGYHANVGCIGALNLPSTLFVADKLIHASAIDGLRTCGANFVRFRHNDTEHLERIIANKGSDFRHIVIIVESVYSMDGDLAPLDALIKLKHKDERIVLYVDEAHGVGVFGEHGLGLCEQTNYIEDIDLIVGTAGKALASVGAYTICSTSMKRWLLNSARPFIFSTALPPACCAWTLLMLEKMTAMYTEREHLQHLWQWLGKCLNRSACSQIIPYLTGDAAKALTLADRLHTAGLDVLPIRRPTVPPGGERLRISLNALLTESNLQPLITLLNSYQ